MNWAGMIIVLAGLFTLFGGLLNWNWLMKARKTRLFLRIFGRMGVRVIYMAVGLALLVYGVLIVFNVVGFD